MEISTGPDSKSLLSITSAVEEPTSSPNGNGTDIELYSYWKSSCSFRVRIALNLKNIKYKYIPVNLKNDEQFDDKYISSNAMKQVPTLKIDGIILTQSVPIMEYLEERYRSKASGIRLLPNDLSARAKVRQITEIINSGIQPAQNLSLRKKVISIRTEYEGIKLSKDEPLKAKYIGTWCKESIENGFDALEKLLEKTAGIYCVGNDVSMADCCLIPQIFNAVRFNVNVEKYQNIHRIYTNCMHTKPFRNAQPNRQPDAPKMSKL